MKNFRTPLALAAVLVTAPLLANPLAHPLAHPVPQDLRNFDNFIGYVVDRGESGDIAAIMNCFAPGITGDLSLPIDGTATTISRPELLSYEIQRHGSSRFSRDIARFSDGFALVDADGTMQNLHASARNNPEHVIITGNRVKLRRQPGGEVICLLDAGTYSGGHNPAELAVGGNGYIWRPVIINHPDLGKVKGFVSDDYVRFPKALGPISLRAHYNGERWFLTGFKRETIQESACAD